MDVPSEDREVVDREYGDFTERAGTLIHHFFGRVWNEGKVELTELMWSPDIVFHSPLEPGPLVGRERLLEHVYAIQNAFSDLHFDIEDKIAEADRVVLRVTQTGSHTGDYFGLPPGGRRVEMPEIFIFRASPQGPLRARVEEIWLVLNALSLLQQMGYFPRGSPPRALFQVVLGFQKVGRVFRRDTNPAQADARATAPGGEAPGPRGIGYLPRFVRDPPGALMEARERYGDVVKYRQGPLKGYLIFHPDELKHVFADRVDDYGHGRWVTSKVRAALGTNVFTLDGDAWRRRRAMLEPEFTPDRVARFAGPIVENATRTVERWEGLSDPVDVVAEMEDLSRTNAGRAIFGGDWDTHSDVLSAARPIFLAQSGRELNSPLG